MPANTSHEFNKTPYNFDSVEYYLSLETQNNNNESNSKNINQINQKNMNSMSKSNA